MKNRPYAVSDEQLVANLQNGDKNAMGELYVRYYMLVFNKCLSFSKDTYVAADLAHDVMLRVMEKINSFNGRSKFSTWLFSITFNYCTDQKRKSKGNYIEPIESCFNLSDTHYEEKVSLCELERKERCAVKILSVICKDDQQLLFMKYHENRSIREIQELFNISASAVKMRLSRARAKAIDMYKNEIAA
jgi:RNA polymerase sigma factor (sigma-70 family)